MQDPRKELSMAVDRTTVERVARLSRLELSEPEKEALTTQMARIVQFVEKINELDTSGIEPLPRDATSANVEREDVPHKNAVSRDEILALAPESRDGSILVPRVIE